MVSKRDPHGRGVRGPLARENPWTARPAPVRLTPSRVEFFRDCVNDSIARIESTCPDALHGVDVGTVAVPTPNAMWQGMIDHDEIPLANAVEATDNALARVVLYERPIERRALDREDLAVLVHRTLVEQLALLTGRSDHEIDPGLEDD